MKTFRVRVLFEGVKTIYFFSYVAIIHFIQLGQKQFHRVRDEWKAPTDENSEKNRFKPVLMQRLRHG